MADKKAMPSGGNSPRQTANSLNSVTYYTVHFNPDRYALDSGGRISPSSWDDSDDELTETNSSAGCVRDVAKSHDGNAQTGSCGGAKGSEESKKGPEIKAEDRRKSLPRVRRRTSSSSCSQSKEISEIEEIGRGSSGEKATEPPEGCRGQVPPKNPSAGDGGESNNFYEDVFVKDWARDRGRSHILTDIENYVNEKTLSFFQSHIICSQSILNDSLYRNPILKAKSARSNPPKMSEASEDFQRKLNLTLSRILEVEESNANLRNGDDGPQTCGDGLNPGGGDPNSNERSGDVSERPFPQGQRFESATRTVDNGGNRRLFPSSDESPVSAEEYTERNGFETENSARIVEIVDGDDDERIASRILQKNSQYAMKSDDAEYINYTLKYIFDTVSDNVQLEYSLNFENQLPEGSENRVDDGVQTAAFEESSKVENEKIYRSMGTNTTGDNVEERSSQVDKSVGTTGQEDLTKLENSADIQQVDRPATEVDSPNDRKSRDYECPNVGAPLEHRSSVTALQSAALYHELVPRTGREVKLPENDSTMEQRKRQTRTYTPTHSNHNINVPRLKDLKPDDDAGKIKVLHWSRGNRPGSSDGDVYSERGLYDDNCDTSKRLGTDSPGLDDLSPLPETPFGKADKEESGENARNSDSSKKSGSSLKTPIFIDLDLSDNEDKFSTIDRKVFGGTSRDGDLSKKTEDSDGRTYATSPLPTASFSGSSRDRRVEDSTSRKSSALEERSMKTGRSPATRSFRVKNEIFKRSEKYGKNNESTFDRDQLGTGDYGDTKWNLYNVTGYDFDFPQDRGDVQRDYYKSRIESEWGKLVAKLDEERRIKAEKEHAENFWREVEERLHNARTTVCKRREPDLDDRTYRQSVGEVDRGKSFVNTRKQCIAHVVPSPTMSDVSTQFPSTKRRRCTLVNARKRKRDAFGGAINCVCEASDSDEAPFLADGRTVDEAGDEGLGSYLQTSHRASTVKDNLKGLKANATLVHVNDGFFARSVKSVRDFVSLAKRNPTDTSGDGSDFRRHQKRHCSTPSGSADGAKGCFQSFFKLLANLFTVSSSSTNRK